MSFGTRLRERREEKRLKQGELGKLLGITGSAIGNYENGVSFPKPDILCRMFGALDCDANMLFQDDIGQKPGALSIDELRLIKKYRALDGHGKRIVDFALEEESGRLAAQLAEAAHQEPARKKIPLYLTPAAAGYNSPAYGDDYVDYETDPESLADFAVKIQGDSMEPYIKDGSVVLVRRQESLTPGDVGLFFVDGSMKCKQYCEDSFGNIYLFSLNRSRADADVTVWASSGITVMCYGRVLLAKRPPLPED